MTNQVFIERKRLTVLIGCRYDTIDRMVERASYHAQSVWAEMAGIASFGPRLNPR